MRTFRKEAFTLVEVLVAIAIFGAVIATISAMWIGANRTSSTTFTITEAQQRAREAMVRIEREVRSGSLSSVDSLALPTVLAFDSMLPNDITYTSLRYFANAEQHLIREADGVESTIAQNVDEFSVDTATGRTVVISLTVTVNDTSRTLETEVQFRNP